MTGRARGHLTLIVSNALPTPVPTAQPRRPDLDVMDAARRWADEVHAARLRPDQTPAGLAARDLLDAIQTLDNFELSNRAPRSTCLRTTNDPGR